MGYKESTLTNQVRLAAGVYGLRLFRNNVGVFETVHGTKISTGLQKGSGDLIGWAPFIILTDRHKIALFFSVELKTKTGRLSTEQSAWKYRVNCDGGVALVVNSVEEFHTQMHRALNSLKDQGICLATSGG